MFEDPQAIIIDQLNSLGTLDPLKVSVLESNMLDAELANQVVMYFRMLTSAAIQLRADFFAPFIMVCILFFTTLPVPQTLSSVSSYMEGGLRIMACCSLLCH